MYEYVKGALASADLRCAVVDCGGVGYKCFISLNTYKKISGKPTVCLLTHLNVKEGVMDLYGFADENERALFRMLLEVSGVGPKAALAVLSDLSPDEFTLTLAAGDVKRLTKISGIGAKTAQRICLELKDKVAGDLSGAELPDSGDWAVPADAKAEAVEALVALGYGRNDARSAVAHCAADNTTDLIKQALRKLSAV